MTDYFYCFLDRVQVVSEYPSTPKRLLCLWSPVRPEDGEAAVRAEESCEFELKQRHLTPGFEEYRET